MSDRPRLLFVSPRFLLPPDEGGKIRTTQILRGMKGGRFEIILASPESPGQSEAHQEALGAICDRFVSWPAVPRSGLQKAMRLRHLVADVPVSVAAGRNQPAMDLVRQQLAQGIDIAVFDFVHAATLMPEQSDCPTLMFTHNVEAEIFRRHAMVSPNPLKRRVWSSQYRKMAAFEAQQLPRFDAVVAVSERDADSFSKLEGVQRVETIPTGVDLEFFSYHEPGDEDHIVFTGAMDWQANIDGIGFFMDEVWPLLTRQRPNARVTIVGRNPAPALVEAAQKRRLPWTFTGFVDDIRPHVQGAAVYVIPLRVGGGTRIKAYEAMAMGLPVVSTTLGVEGLPLTPDEHYRLADSPEEMARAIDQVLSDAALKQRLSRSARQHVEDHCSSLAVARCFEAICWDTLNRE
ncbi:glycosyltransferase [Ectothiorhodospira variabilis]|uniref:glycosyltransferase n=1 Tax=Ectothiorhodospira variabilis TaxID=505694 RepID=UPI001EFC12BF|nr:glycosyltransferase family 4 protein [Ectothiorhodospira variabilis]